MKLLNKFFIISKISLSWISICLEIWNLPAAKAKMMKTFMFDCCCVLFTCLIRVDGDWGECWQYLYPSKRKLISYITGRLTGNSHNSFIFLINPRYWNGETFKDFFLLEIIFFCFIFLKDMCYIVFLSKLPAPAFVGLNSTETTLKRQIDQRQLY